MTKIEYLLVTLGEECGELQQAASKCLRFGTDDVWQETTNLQRVKTEFSNVVALYSMVMGALNEESDVDIECVATHINKVNHYLDYSKTKGIVQ